MAALEAATSLASAALAADWPGRREAVATAAAMLAAGRAKRGGESTTATREGTRDIRACLQAGIEARPSGHSSPTPPPARQGVRCYQAHTEANATCKYHGYCCGSCRLKHTGEKPAAKDHGPSCQHILYVEAERLAAEGGAASDDEDDNPWIGLED